jgi:hypothetical protein
LPLHRPLAQVVPLVLNISHHILMLGSSVFISFPGDGR